MSKWKIIGKLLRAIACVLCAGKDCKKAVKLVREVLWDLNEREDQIDE